MKKRIFPFRFSRIEIILLLLISGLILFQPACKKDDDSGSGDPSNPGDTTTVDPGPELPSGTSYIAPSTQRSGDPTIGYEYLVYGDYVGQGIPYDAYVAAAPLLFGSGAENILNREGLSADVRYDFNTTLAPNGIQVVNANCLQCHAETLNGEFILGLGSTTWDFTSEQSDLIPTVDLGMDLFGYGEGTPEWEAYLPFRKAVLATGPYLKTEVIGINPADKLAAVLAAHRNKDDLTWYDEPQLPIPEGVVASDVPAWWLLKKKNAMFYTAVGRGDFSRIMMASSLLTVQDTATARNVDNNFADVQAFINSLEAPVFTGSIDQDIANQGKLIFEQNCASCHGTYGADESYPNLLVDISTVGTDSLLAYANYGFGDFVDWYNNSWFAEEPYSAELIPGTGYVAPPLDGVWATAPYLHNGSVPSLYTLLKSGERPTYWQRSFNTDDYDMENIGWNYTETSGGGDKTIYDTTLPSYGNQGHYYGDGFSEEDRMALIEYLKTL